MTTRMKQIKIAATVLFVFSVSAGAQTVSCDKINVEIDRNQKILSVSAPIGENSPIRENNRLLAHTIAASLIQSNLILLAANHCRMPTEPISDTTYTKNAMECATLKMQTGMDDALVRDRCNIALWSRNFNAQ